MYLLLSIVKYEAIIIRDYRGRERRERMLCIVTRHKIIIGAVIQITLIITICMLMKIRGD